MTRTILVTGAGGPLGVNFCRSLRASDQALRLVGTDANPYHLPLSLCDVTYQIPFAKEPAAYEAALCEIAAKEKVDVIIPTHPVEVRAVAKLRDSASLGGMKTALPSTEILDISDDKVRTHATLAAASIAVPRTMVIHNESDLRVAFDEYWQEDMPVWVRGAGIPGHGIGGAALPCRTVEIASAWIEHYRGWGKMAASEYLPGANLTWMALYSKGVLVASAARERLEYVLPHVSPSGITGAPAVSRTIENEALEEIGARAVGAIDARPHGVYFVDFKEDKDGCPLVTEINGGRCGTTIHFYTEAGCNFPDLLQQLAFDGEVPSLANAKRVVSAGQYWIRTLDCGPVLVREQAFSSFPSAGLIGQENS